MVLGQVNHLAPFYLTDLLLPNLKQAYKGAQRMVQVLRSLTFIIQQLVVRPTFAALAVISSLGSREVDALLQYDISLLSRAPP